MIDTVIIRLHSTRKYEILIRELNERKQEGYVLEKMALDKNEADAWRKKGKKDPQELYTTLKFLGKADKVVQSERFKVLNRKGHYLYSVNIDWKRDFIEFNLSIPKYLHGSNVFMFVLHQKDIKFKYAENRGFTANHDWAIENFFKFIDYFFKQEFYYHGINKEDVEINRIDLCYNQVFNSKKEALEYLSYQKKIKKKYTPENEERKTHWDTSFMFSTNRYSFKVYHKGTEYKKHEYKEHKKVNEAKQRNYFNTNEIQAFADLMLRYELTLRNGEINYLFKNNLFRRNCPLFKIDYKSYTRVLNIKQRNARINKYAHSLPLDQKAIYRKYNPLERIDSNDNKTYKYVSQLVERKPYFCLKIEPHDEKFNEVTVNYPCSYAKFDKDLLSICFQLFISCIKEFNVKSLPNEEAIGILIDKYNQKSKVKFNKAEMVQFYFLWVKNGSFEAAGKESRYSRATLFRYKAKFKKIGITPAYMEPDTNELIPKANFDFQKYHDYLLRSYSFSSTIRSMNL